MAKKKASALADIANQERRAKRSCTVCNHPQRAEIEAFIDEWRGMTPRQKQALGLHRAISEYLPERVDCAPSRQTCVDHVRRCLGDAEFFRRGA
jgi:hypothetical protein